MVKTENSKTNKKEKRNMQVSLFGIRARGIQINVFLFLLQKPCCGYLLEASPQDSSNDFQQHIIYGEIRKCQYFLFGWKRKKEKKDLSS